VRYHELRQLTREHVRAQRDSPTRAIGIEQQHVDGRAAVKMPHFVCPQPMHGREIRWSLDNHDCTAGYMRQAGVALRQISTIKHVGAFIGEADQGPSCRIRFIL
jgi:hypothetical protein